MIKIYTQCNLVRNQISLYPAPSLPFIRRRLCRPPVTAPIQPPRIGVLLFLQCEMVACPCYCLRLLSSLPAAVARTRQARRYFQIGNIGQPKMLENVMNMPPDMATRLIYEKREARSVPTSTRCTCFMSRPTRGRLCTQAVLDTVHSPVRWNGSIPSAGATVVRLRDR